MRRASLSVPKAFSSWLPVLQRQFSHSLWLLLPAEGTLLFPESRYPAPVFAFSASVLPEPEPSVLPFSDGSLRTFGRPSPLLFQSCSHPAVRRAFPQYPRAFHSYGPGRFLRRRFFQTCPSGPARWPLSQLPALFLPEPFPLFLPDGDAIWNRTPDRASLLSDAPPESLPVRPETPGSATDIPADAPPPFSQTAGMPSVIFHTAPEEPHILTVLFSVCPALYSAGPPLPSAP